MTPDRQQTGTTAGEYARPAVQSKLRELRRRLAPLALCPGVRNRKTPRSFQSRNLTEVSVFSTVLPHFRYSSVETHCKSDRGVTLATEPLVTGYKKNETRHSREAPHTNHIINNTKTNNRVQRYGHSVNPQYLTS